MYFYWGVIISVVVESLPLDRLNINDFFRPQPYQVNQWMEFRLTSTEYMTMAR